MAAKFKSFSFEEIEAPIYQFKNTLLEITRKSRQEFRDTIKRIAAESSAVKT